MLVTMGTSNENKLSCAGPLVKNLLIVEFSDNLRENGGFLGDEQGLLGMLTDAPEWHLGTGTYARKHV